MTNKNRKNEEKMAMRYIACSKRSNAKVNIHFRRALNINDDCSYSPPPSFSCPMHEVYIVLSANTNQIIDANKYIQFCWKPIHARTQIIVTRKNSLSLTNDFPKWDLSHNVPPRKTGARSVWWKCDSDSTEVMHINGKYPHFCNISFIIRLLVAAAPKSVYITSHQLTICEFMYKKCMGCHKNLTDDTHYRKLFK